LLAADCVSPLDAAAIDVRNTLRNSAERQRGERRNERDTPMPKKTTKRYAILANKSYGLYVGVIEKYDPVTGVAEVSDCRHVARWFGKTGGITSLAAHGLCGPRAGESRIGAPTRATLTGIVNVFDCTSEARATFEAAKPQ
jgi:hypothetical protein